MHKTQGILNRIRRIIGVPITVLFVLYLISWILVLTKLKEFPLAGILAVSGYIFFGLRAGIFMIRDRKFAYANLIAFIWFLVFLFVLFSLDPFVGKVETKTPPLWIMVLNDCVVPMALVLDCLYDWYLRRELHRS
jgi:hypothetical protein